MAGTGLVTTKESSGPVDRSTGPCRFDGCRAQREGVWWNGKKIPHGAGWAPCGFGDGQAVAGFASLASFQMLMCFVSGISHSERMKHPSGTRIG